MTFTPYRPVDIMETLFNVEPGSGHGDRNHEVLFKFPGKSRKIISVNRPTTQMREKLKENKLLTLVWQRWEDQVD